MPIYEYACRSCEHQFESIQKASEAPLEDCPACGEAALKKLLSAPVFRLKGSGWYETDFKTGDKRNVVDAGDARKEAGQEADKTDKGAAKGGEAAKEGDAGKGSGEGAKARSAAADGSQSSGKSADKPASKGSGSSVRRAGANAAGAAGGADKGRGAAAKPAPDKR